MDGEMRMIRQHLLLSPKLQAATVVVAGVGMLGSWTALALGRIVNTMYLVDDDIVAPENLGTQAYNERDLGNTKVYATAKQLEGVCRVYDIAARMPDAAVEMVLPWEGSGQPLIVINSVDSFAARKQIAIWARDAGAQAIIDLRVHGTVGVFLLVPPKDFDTYIDTLEADENAPEPLCGAEGTGFVALRLASLTCSNLNSYFAGHETLRRHVEDVRFGEPLSDDQFNESEVFEALPV